MTRDAKLYFLFGKELQPLIDIINMDTSIQNEITIYQLMSHTSTGKEYGILSLSDLADKTIEDYGGTIADKDEMIKITLHKYFGDPLYGNKDNLSHLR